MSAKVTVDFVANEADLIAAAKNAQKEMDAFSAKLKAAGVSGSAFNKAMAEAKRRHEEAAGAAQKQRMSIADLKAGIDMAVQALQMLKKGYDFAKEGAQLEFQAQKFDRLAATIGTTGEALSGKLMVATKGTMSQMDAMASATDLVSLGLVNTEKDVVRLSSVVSGLGMDMNQLVLALSNQTTMRFDQLGVAVVGFDEKVKALEATGMSAQEAFTEAFLQQAEEQLLKVGNAADTSAGQFMRFEAQLEDMGNEAKMLAGQLAGPLVGAMAENMKANREWRDALQQADPELLKQYMWTQTITPEMQKVITEYQNAQTQMNVMEQAARGLNRSLVEQVEVVELTEEQIKAISAENQSFIGVLGNVVAAQETYYGGLAEAKAALDEGTMSTEEHAAKVSQLAADYQAASQAIVMSIVEMKLASDGWTDAELDAYLQIGQGMGQFTADQVKMAKGAVTMADQMIESYTQVEDPLNHISERAEDTAENFGEMADAGAELAESLRKEVASGAAFATAALNAIPTVINVDIYIRTRGGGFSDGFLETGGGPLCFAAGTPVTLSDGRTKPIEQMQVNDAVRSYSLARREFVTGTVTKNFKRNQPAYLNIDGIKVTVEHPFWLVNRSEWVKAGDIKRNDIFLRDNGSWQTVRNITFIVEEIDVYNMEVEGENNYFAGGVLVHNKTQQGGEVFAGQPTLVGEAGPEPFVPSQNGRILGHAESLHAMTVGGAGGGMGGNITMYNYGHVTVSGDSETGKDFMEIR
jgi:hypothetical protein